MEPTIGRIVIFKIDADQAAEINRRRTSSKSIAERIEQNNWPIGAQAHIGNIATEGDEYPMIVCRVWGAGLVNGQVFLDGNDTYWVLSRGQGDLNGQWHWPVISK